MHRLLEYGIESNTLFATIRMDWEIRLFDPRTGWEAVRITDEHGGIKGARVCMDGRC